MQRRLPHRTHQPSPRPLRVNERKFEASDGARRKTRQEVRSARTSNRETRRAHHASSICGSVTPAVEILAAEEMTDLREREARG